MRIDHLADHRDAIPTLASWIWSKWADSFPGLTRGELLTELAGRAGRRTIPQTLVAVEAGVPVGTVSIVESIYPFQHERFPPKNSCPTRFAHPGIKDIPEGIPQ